MRANPSLPRDFKTARGVVYQPVTKVWDVYVLLVPGRREFVGACKTLEETKQRYTEKYIDRQHGGWLTDIPTYKDPDGPVPNSQV
ncbi:MAG: hypothetical protein K2X87_16965 [Gemmataceae bacterium]|nr:hypothetical protein [Gemmataceae bacterium]